ncbi:MAG: hypothetical protein ACLFVH_00740 [Phycisphaerae bacterium]
MGLDTSVDISRRAKELFDSAELVRPMRVERYDPGDELTYDVTGVFPANAARVTVIIDKFVGGGFAGQVYRVTVRSIEAADGPVEGLTEGSQYAMKILRPPSRFSQKFRDAVYAVGFQAPFSLQVNPSAARAGALWQKFIRRAAGEEFNDERSVVDIYATFIDENLGSCGELSEWVEGRTWRFEVDDRLQDRFRSIPGREELSPEYQSKKRFMDDFVALLHRVGAHEFARQYEWWTCKSQPNALKRRDTEDDPHKGLTAVDFRAGLALLPFLPMAPGDVPLIVKGLLRGSLVQFDRGDLKKLRQYMRSHPETFKDMDSAFAELVQADDEYRQSMPDITHNHVHLLYDGDLWRQIVHSLIDSYEIRNLADEEAAAEMRRSPLKAIGFGLLGLAAPVVRLLAVAWAIVLGIHAATTEASLGDVFSVWTILGLVLLAVAVPRLLRLLRLIWGRTDLRTHFRRMFTEPGYFLRALRGRNAETLLAWYRAGRISDSRARRFADAPWQMAFHLPLSVLPTILHRGLTDWTFAKTKLAYVFVRPIRLFFIADAREAWLREMVADGLKRHMLTEEDAERILSRIKEPFIQKYLKSLAVHVCTLPVTQVVSVIVALWYKYYFGIPWSEAWDEMVAILVLFQVVPISPGSLTRGLYVVYLVIKERNFKDYNIAVFLGFFKYVGYLAFPIQMAYRYPTLARFMAGHWATGAVHVVPVFGEHGALAEHAVFDLFYNYPLTVRRRLRLKAALREDQPERWRHLPMVIACAGGALVLIDTVYWALSFDMPTMKSLWYVIALPALAGGMAAAHWARGASTPRRVLMGPIVGACAGVLYAISNTVINHVIGNSNVSTYAEAAGWLGMTALWAVFIFSLVGVVGAFIAESREPQVPSDRREEIEHFIQTIEQDGGMSDRLEDQAPDKLRDDIRVDSRDEIIA